MLEHLKPECVGNWHLNTYGAKGPTLKCDTCFIVYPATPENKEVAKNENYAGIYLRRLTAEGVQKYGPHPR